MHSPRRRRRAETSVSCTAACSLISAIRPCAALVKLVSKRQRPAAEWGSCCWGGWLNAGLPSRHCASTRRSGRNPPLLNRGFKESAASLTPRAPERLNAWSLAAMRWPRLGIHATAATSHRVLRTPGAGRTRWCPPEHHSPGKLQEQRTSQRAAQGCGRSGESGTTHRRVACFGRRTRHGIRGGWPGLPGPHKQKARRLVTFGLQRLAARGRHASNRFNRASDRRRTVRLRSSPSARRWKTAPRSWW